MLDTLENSMYEFGETAVNVIPKLITAIILIIIGVLVGKLVAKIVKRILDKVGIQKAGEKLQLDSLMEGASSKISSFISKIIYFFILLVFVITATDVMGLEMVSVEVNKLMAYMPILLSAIIVFIIGFFVANLVRDGIWNATKSMGISAGRLIGNVVYIFLLLMVVLTAMKQAKIDTALISQNMVMFIASVLLAAGISYGIASRHVLSNVLATFYMKDRFTEGQRIRVDGVEGVVIEVTNINIVLQTSNGKVWLPSSKVINNNVEILD